MDNVTADPGIQLRRHHSHLGHTIKWSRWPPGEHAHCFFYSAKIFGSGSLPKLYLPNTGNLAQNMLCNADPCPEAPLGRRFHLQPQASAELPANEHQPPPLRSQQVAVNRSLLRLKRTEVEPQVTTETQNWTVAEMVYVSCPLIWRRSFCSMYMFTWQDFLVSCLFRWNLAYTAAYADVSWEEKYCSFAAKYYWNSAAEHGINFYKLVCRPASPSTDGILFFW